MPFRTNQTLFGNFALKELQLWTDLSQRRKRTAHPRRENAQNSATCPGGHDAVERRTVGVWSSAVGTDPPTGGNCIHNPLEKSVIVLERNIIARKRGAVEEGLHVKTHDRASRSAAASFRIVIKGAGIHTPSRTTSSRRTSGGPTVQIVSR